MKKWTKVEMTDYDAYESPCGKYRVRPYHKRIDDFSEKILWRPGKSIGNGSFSYLDTDFLYHSKYYLYKKLENKELDSEF